MSAIVDGIIGGCLRSLSRAATKPLFPLLSAVALGGCSIHPVQRDVTQIPTPQIVDQIRCEARLAVLDKAISKLREYDDPTGRARILADDLETKRGQQLAFDPLLLPPGAPRAFYNRYINTAIAYEFSFDISESNGAGFSVDPVRLISGGAGLAGVTLGASSSLSRNNIRRFKMADSFGGLLFKPLTNCSRNYYLADNFVYPIAGNVGLRELIHTFIDLNEDAQLLASKDDGPRVFGDTLKFSTTLSGSATPHVQLDPVGNRFGLAPSNVGLSASRSDIHTLTIGLSMGAEGRVPLASVSRGMFSLSGRSKPQSVPYGAASANVHRALETIDEQYWRNFLDRTGTLILR
jgi:hypothetical protein